MEEATDDAFPEFLNQKYLNDPGRNKFVSEEELCKELDIANLNQPVNAGWV